MLGTNANPPSPVEFVNSIAKMQNKTNREHGCCVKTSSREQYNRYIGSLVSSEGQSEIFKDQVGNSDVALELELMRIILTDSS